MYNMGMVGDKYLPEDVARAILEAQGMLSVAAKLMRCSTQTIRNYIAEHQCCKDAALDAAEELKDMAEMKLVERVEGGDFKATRYYLEAKAPERGYTKRGFNTAPGLPPSQYNFLLNLSNQELVDAIRQFTLPAGPSDPDPDHSPIDVDAGGPRSSTGISSVSVPVDGSEAQGFAPSESIPVGLDERATAA